MKKKYEEQYQTCVFFARAAYYCTLIGYGNDEKFAKYEQYFYEIEQAAPGFIGPTQETTFLGNIFLKFLPNQSKLFTLPFVRGPFTASPRKAYQIWCEKLDGYFTPEEQKTIIEENLKIDPSSHQGPEWDIHAERAWRFMQYEKNYIPFISEIKWLYNKIRYGYYFVTWHP